MPLHKPGLETVLVVGTTPDYIEWIRKRLPRKALFLTDPELRNHAAEPKPAPEEEVLCRLSDKGNVLKALSRHLEKYCIELAGIASFDCESIPLAADLAQNLNLPYCSAESVAVCQNKLVSKQKWAQNGLFTPRVAEVESEAHLVDFFHKTNGGCVLKPQNGTGSELVFLCSTEDECRKYYRLINDSRKPACFNESTHSNGQANKIIAEAFINGEEFSCDFIIKDKHIQIIRICRKILLKHGPTGTAQAYVLLPACQTQVNTAELKKTLYKGAKALNIDSALCMADMIVKDGSIYLLEITPRPGGDCLPYLLAYARNMDILGLTLAFACQKQISLPRHFQEKPIVGLRIHGTEAGVLEKIDTTRAISDPRVRQVFIKKTAGHRITLPPEDYDSWVLGHVIFVPFDGNDIEGQCRQIRDGIEIAVK